MSGPVQVDMWCYSCDNKTIHEIRLKPFMKLLVCAMCGETVRESAMETTGLVD
jgi:hypothetical protein